MFGIRSNILGSPLRVIFCRALIASFLSRSSLTSIVPTNDQLLSHSLSSQVERVIHTIPCIKHRKNCKSCSTQVTWRVKLNVRSVCHVCPIRPDCPVFPVCPDDHDDHDEFDHNDNHDNQFCTFTFWQQTAL